MSSFEIKNRYEIRNGASIKATENEDESFEVIISFTADDGAPQGDGDYEFYKANVGKITNDCLLNDSVTDIEAKIVSSNAERNENSYSTTIELNGLSFAEIEEIEDNYDISVAKMSIVQGGKYVLCFEGNDGEMRFIADPTDKFTRNPEKAAIIKEEDLRDLEDYWEERIGETIEEMDYKDFKMSYLL